MTDLRERLTELAHGFLAGYYNKADREELAIAAAQIALQTAIDACRRAAARENGDSPMVILGRLFEEARRQ